MPQIEKYASFAFRRLDIEARGEAIAEVIASSWVAFKRLCEAGKSSLAYPSVLVKYGVAQYFAGRRVGSRTNTKDLTSPAAQAKHGFRVESLTPPGDDGDEAWKALVVEDRRTGPAEVAGLRIDFNDFLGQLLAKKRDIAKDMCEGHNTSELAERNGVSSGRISQLRRELEEAWNQFSETELAAV